MPYSLTILDVVLGLLGLFLLLQLRIRDSTPYPPGPKGFPIIGNALDMPSERIWQTIAHWGEIYGDIVYLHVLANRFIFLNSPQVAYELLDKKSLIYSDRPVLPMASELVGWAKTLALIQFGDEFKARRKLIHSFMGTHSSADQLAPIEEHEVKTFLKSVLNDPPQFVEAIRRTAGGIILRATYGYEPQERGDLLVQQIDQVMEQFSVMSVPGAFLVDIVPALKYIPSWFPGAKFKRIASEWAQCLEDAVIAPLSYVKEQMARGDASSSFVRNCLEDQDLTAEQDYTIKWAAAAMYGGGADTTVSSIETFLLLMMLYPEAQKKAQAEIDAIIGNGRLPCSADMGQLPYVEALVKEVLRWHPVAPLGIPHCVKEDNVYKGYFIPKGTAVIANIWGFLHDAKLYTDPMVFKPERFLGSHPEQDPREYCFGFGRRLCPGRHLAWSSVWLSCAMSLAVFAIRKPTDSSGNAIEPTVDFTNNTISHPVPFQCSITPRSDAARLLILAQDEIK
ncbi:cytochrome P450 [Heliocybe sulcata]|uniref:Cytochrome P450 n=1 Tax=Heliocybe sulcata TaxID=5364 RepID=A0A5C3MYC2_9AGAM|nr:cytochrome P450 [Heliocybe sulcata]